MIEDRSVPFWRTMAVVGVGVAVVGVGKGVRIRDEIYFDCAYIVGNQKIVIFAKRTFKYYGHDQFQCRY